MPKPKPSQLSQSPLMPGHLGQTLVIDMTFCCRPDVVGSLDSRASRSNCLFFLYGSKCPNLRIPQKGHAKITQTDAFNYMSYHFLCKRGIRPARTEQFLVPVGLSGPTQGNPSKNVVSANESKDLRVLFCDYGFYEYTR